jgi:hypothetical protein
MSEWIDINDSVPDATGMYWVAGSGDCWGRKTEERKVYKKKWEEKQWNHEKPSFGSEYKDMGSTSWIVDVSITHWAKDEAPELPEGK